MTEAVLEIPLADDPTETLHEEDFRSESASKIYFFWNGQKYSIDKRLAVQLDTLIYNTDHDFDFVILITGNRTVRVGKSVLAMAVGAYIAAHLQRRKYATSYKIDDIYFDHRMLMKSALKNANHSIIHYDEGREGLAANKSFEKFQRELLDFFAEAGQKNHFYIIVLPDFFELKEVMAVARSDCLLNCYIRKRKRAVDLYGEGFKRNVISFERGYFQFFNRQQKAKLYDMAKTTKKKSYGIAPALFSNGTFAHQYTINEEEYRNKKLAFLQRFGETSVTEKSHKSDVLRDALVWQLSQEGHKSQKIESILKEKYGFKLGDETIRTIIKRKSNPENPNTGTIKEIEYGKNAASDAGKKELH